MRAGTPEGAIGLRLLQKIAEERRGEFMRKKAIMITKEEAFELIKNHKESENGDHQ